MHKRKKEKLLRKITAALLSAALVVGTTQGAVPTNVLAKENSTENIEDPESVDENATRFTEEETSTESDEEEVKTEPVMEEIVTEDEKETVAEDTKESVVEEQDDETDQNQAEPAVQAVKSVSGDDWTLDDDGKLTIISDNGMKDWLETLDWEDIGEWEEEYVCNGSLHKTQVITVEIEDGVTNIGDYAFYRCENLTGVTIPDSMESIGEQAFWRCSSLTNITIPENVTSIGKQAFYDCRSLTGVTILDGVTSIGEQAFQSCSNLTSATIPDSVESIVDYMFCDCRSLVSIEIPENVTKIDTYAFSGCSSLASIEIPSGVTSIGNNAFQNCSSLTSIEIPSGVESIKNNTFDGCSSLTSVTMLRETPPTLGTNVFKGCKFVTDNTKGIYVPSGMASAYRDAWTACADYIVEKTESVSGTDWTLDADGKLTITSDAGMTDWISKAADHKVQVKTVEIQDGVTSIEKNAFSGCSSLTGIEIPNSVTEIKKNAFIGCSDLTSIEIPDSVTSIGWSAFEGCIGLTNVEIPDSVTEIDISAFKDCTGLTSVKISNNVKRMGSVFQGCSSLTSIIIPEGVTSIGGGTFQGCSSLTDVTLPESLENIQGNVFNGCSSLTSITIPENVGGIWQSAFKDCIGLTSIEIPDKVDFIYPSTFEGCSNLKSIKMPDSAGGIGLYAFKNCTSLMSITIPSNVTVIGANAFENCTSLVSVTVLPTTPPSLDRHYVSEAAPDYPEEVFKGCKFVTDNVKGVGIYVPLGTAKTYQKAWQNWAYYIEPKLDITTQPTAPADVQNGQEVSFSVAAEGDGTITYQWQVDKKDGNGFVNIESATSTTYTISKVDKTIHNGYTYRCVVTSDVEERSITSNEVLLTVRDSDAEKVAAAKPIVEEWLKNFTPTNDTKEDSFTWNIRETLSKAGIKDVGNKAVILEKTQATLSAAGRIKATITISSGTASDTLEFDKPIAQLESKVEAAKKVVEDTLPKLTLTNDTTHADIQTAIDEALKQEGVTGVTATVKPIAKQEATTGDKGFISFNVEIACPTEDTKTIGPKILDIPKLPKTDAEKVEAAKKVVQNALRDFRATNATTKESIQAVINEALEKAAATSLNAEVADVTVIVGEITKIDATSNKIGSISGTITLTCNNANDTVEINKTITQLPQTDVEKVFRAKEVVEEALVLLTVDNDTTKEDIENAINTALSAAGIPDDVTVTVGEINKTDATKDAVGSIRGTITIQCGTVTETVEISKTIAKLPVTDADKKVGAAKEVVEAALEGLTVNNDTTKEDIQAAIDKALSDAEITDVTVTVGEITKTEATTDADGSIGGIITIQCGDATAEVTLSKTIEKIEITEKTQTGVWIQFTDYDKLEDSKPCYKYTGIAVNPDIKVYNNETLLTLGRDYTVGYKNNIKAGAATLTVKGKGNFSGTSNEVSFKIINADISTDTAHPTDMTVVAGTKVAPVIMNGTKALTAKDYELSGDGLDKGKYASSTPDGTFNTLTVKGIGSYEGSFTIQVKVIDKSAAQKLAVTIDKNFKPVYDGKALNLNDLFQGTANPNGVITVTDSKDKTKTLEKGQDYTVVCKSNLTNAGTVKFTVTGMGVYAGSVSKTISISPLKAADSGKFTVTFDETKEYEYKASGTEVDGLTVKYTVSETNVQTLRQGTDYKVSYSNNKIVSDSKKAQLKITFLGNYKGSAPLSRDFEIKAAKMSAANTKVTLPDIVYSKADKAYKSTPIVTVDGAAVKASNYDVSYKWATESKAGNDAEYTEGNKLTIAEGDTYAKVKVTITPKGSFYSLAQGAVIEGEYYVRKADGATDLSKAKVTFHDKAGNQLKNLEYNGAVFYTPEGNNPGAENAPDDANAVYVRVTIKGEKVDEGLYDVIWTNATATGKATVVIRGKGVATAKGAAVGSKNQSISIKAMGLKGKDLKSYMEKAAKNFKNMFL